MGRWEWSNRILVEDCLALSVFKLSENGLLCENRSLSIEWDRGWNCRKDSMGVEVTPCSPEGDPGWIRLIYTATDKTTKEQKQFNYPILITQTFCYFGGARHWLQCPLIINGIPCSQRVGKLYLPPRGSYFGCRKCYDLTYRSQKEHSKSMDVFRKTLRMISRDSRLY